ncbi:EscU/YscU/HrcU family type III secretion system export apparatus switch protein [Chromobacterium vaccinii]|uniref:EscU/YscU/HrcU family type III secretion system export apparatus switch protein n=2 Tax=Chromobacteriaceae TaxID=1499392 RepID=A0ABV0CL98_9NEIS|nr:MULTISPECIES: EscU/YscU/HrcU family type III secretion system export apparatus switch protein [Chromobacteriaceae]AVG16938.1 EscU/YscU/HrcU family type III secretion system export apparatus switch protein [Chromobacterium vaccinii]ERE04178.1 type III secretion system protein SpaS [Pseudogulbenkiania ferrooxidans EGD-HP2]MCD4484610.1 EscU/YscU/HrcU family type III secretion system export apparatus switch protein [Chromobacterium vaccinii]
MAEKTEKPTHKRLRDSAKKGQSFKSRDLVVACLTLCGVAYLVSFSSLAELMGVFRQTIASGFRLDMPGYAKALAWLGLRLFLPIFLLCALASALPSLLQSGFVLASEALKLNLDALNPVNGFKKLFSLRTVKEVVKALLYLASFVVAVFVVWNKHKTLLFAQLHGGPLGLAAIWRELLLSLVLTCLGCIALILILDALAEYFLFMKDMKMEKEEVKREMKEQEGNPEVKSRRREVHMEILSEQVKSDVANSRLIVANPTHIAIGIYFKPELSPAPFISVMETNQRALAVRAHARKVGVPVVRDVPLARRIYASHRRYAFISLDEVDEVLRLLAWLEQVENAGLPEGDDAVEPQ